MAAMASFLRFRGKEGGNDVLRTRVGGAAAGHSPSIEPCARDRAGRVLERRELGGLAARAAEGKAPLAVVHCVTLTCRTSGGSRMV